MRDLTRGEAGYRKKTSSGVLDVNAKVADSGKPTHGALALAYRAKLLASGYLHIPGVLEPRLIAQLHRNIDSQAIAKSAASRDRILRDGYPRLESFRRVAEDVEINALAEAVCGKGAYLHSVKGTVRAATEGELPTHTDTGALTSSPFARLGLFFAVHVICEPFRRENGATFFVPNSHRLLRDPTPAEAASADRTWVDAEPGDLVCWLGETWHGRFLRTVPGDRISLLIMYAAADLLQGAHPRS